MVKLFCSFSVRHCYARKMQSFAEEIQKQLKSKTTAEHVYKGLLEKQFSERNFS